ncbi:hypothetical protein HanIR_Chr06g0297311 [Helianthus annuus]|nr:hypothetical protein HanIR_Chr06g0297311 [Helianthus annuus]
MADQGILFPPFDSLSQLRTAADNSHVQNLPANEYIEGEGTNVRTIRASGICTTQTMTPTSHGAGPSAPTIS